LALYAFYEETVNRTFDNVADCHGCSDIDDFRTFDNDIDPEVEIAQLDGDENEVTNKDPKSLEFDTYLEVGIVADRNINLEVEVVTKLAMKTKIKSQVCKSKLT
jgi:hypothetical protein